MWSLAVVVASPALDHHLRLLRSSLGRGNRRPKDARSSTSHGYFDEKGRLVMIVNHNTDIGDFWEWIDQPMYPLEPSTEALRFGINYFMYAMTP